MNTTKHLLIAAAVTGAMTALPHSAHADSLIGTTRPSADKQGCNGKDGCSGKDGGKDKDKDNCKGKDKQGKNKKDKGNKDKAACAGKDGCGGKK